MSGPLPGKTPGTKQSAPATRGWSVHMADTLMQRQPLLSKRWHYEPGVALLGIQQVWQTTGEQRYSDYIQRNIDSFVDATGNIRTYRMDEYNIDQILQGRLLFPLHARTADERYQIAANLLRAQLETHPRTTDGGFWHKLKYPHQMWLDGIYMSQPFHAQYTATFVANEAQKKAAFDDIARQINLISNHTRDPHTGLLYHGWDERKQEEWANPESGCSTTFWGRALGWFLMALPDVLDYFPPKHVERDTLVEIFRKAAAAVAAVQDGESGLWYQVLDQGSRQGNYLEASASCMFVYALAKGVQKQCLEAGYLETAKKGYQGIIKRFIEVDEQGLLNLHQICSVAGLGGNPYRDGSFECYINEKIVSNELKGIGAFILASAAIEQARS